MHKVSVWRIKPYRRSVPVSRETVPATKQVQGELGNSGMHVRGGETPVRIWLVELLSLSRCDRTQGYNFRQSIRQSAVSCVKLIRTRCRIFPFFFPSSSDDFDDFSLKRVEQCSFIIINEVICLGITISADSYYKER